MSERTRFAVIGLSSLLCFSIGMANAAEPKATPNASPPREARTLDLKAPLITNLFTAQQIDWILSRAVDPELEHVEVEASRIEDVPFVDRSASDSEVVFREVAQWVAPYPTVLAAEVNHAPDVTDPYRPVPVSMGWYHPSFPTPYSQR